MWLVLPSTGVSSGIGVASSARDNDDDGEAEGEYNDAEVAVGSCGYDTDGLAERNGGSPRSMRRNMMSERTNGEERCACTSDQQLLTRSIFGNHRADAYSQRKRCQN